MDLKTFSYNLNAGPFNTADELNNKWTEGNCRRLLQYYFLSEHKIFLKPEQILCPNGYYKTGKFVFKKGHHIDISQLQIGDVLYAERIRDKSGKLINRAREKFNSLDEYLISLHSAIFQNIAGEEILHATQIEGRSCIWSLEQFIHYYKPIAVKRIINK